MLVWLHIVFVIISDRGLVTDGFVHWCWGNRRLVLDVIRTLVLTGRILLLVDPMGLNLASLRACHSLLLLLRCFLELPDLKLLSFPEVVTWIQFVRGLIWFENSWVVLFWMRIR